MHLQDMTWMQVEEHLKTDQRIILITGACEQHAHISLLTDILIPSRIATAVSKKTGVLVAPPLNFGVSHLYADFPGTISLSQQTFDAALSEICESLLLQGFRGFFIMNGHGGNSLPRRLEDLHMEGVLRVYWYEWFRTDIVQQFAEARGLRVDHANWVENFPFVRVDGVDIPAEKKDPVNLAFIEEGLPARNVLGDGSFGGEYQINDTAMQTLFDLVVGDAADVLREF